MSSPSMGLVKWCLELGSTLKKLNKTTLVDDIRCHHFRLRSPNEDR